MTWSTLGIEERTGYDDCLIVGVDDNALAVMTGAIVDSLCVMRPSEHVLVRTVCRSGTLDNRAGSK